MSCNNNQITSLDVSQNKKLLELECCGNLLDTLDLRENSQLEKVNCDDNVQLTGWPRE